MVPLCVKPLSSLVSVRVEINCHTSILPLRSIPTLKLYTIIRINNGNKPHSLYLAFSWIGGSNAMSANQLQVIFRVKAERALLGKEISISLNLISRQKHEVLKMSLSRRGPTATAKLSLSMETWHCLDFLEILTTSLTIHSLLKISIFQNQKHILSQCQFKS